MSTTKPSSKDAEKEKQREYWHLHLQQWKQSNLKQRSYCTQAGISYNSFVYWKSVLSVKLSQIKTKVFVPVKVTNNDSCTTYISNEIKIKLTTGHIVYIPLTIDLETISRLIHLLGISHA